MTRILVVEDDPAIVFGLKTNLAFEGFEVSTAEDLQGALDASARAAPDLVVLDVMLAGGSTGFQVIEALRAGGFGGPILVLSAREAETDKVSALRLGADDYVTKPFGLAELLARIGALLRRSAVSPPATATGRSQQVGFGDCEVDLGSRQLRVGGREVELTKLEFDLLAFLVRNAGRVLSRGHLLRDVWGLSHDGSARTVDNVIAHLRDKLDEDPGAPRHLITLRGAGYRFELEPVGRGKTRKK
ncbi:MAG: response regulator transcription factor [Myxococcales bacterium]|nr:response regulator transcription factor [Myxococcales bacterium]